VFVFNRKTGKYLGRTGKPVRDVHTGDMQKMNSKPPSGGKGCVVVLVAFAGAAPVVAAALTLLHRLV
jgi:hypothetical protein